MPQIFGTKSARSGLVFLEMLELDPDPPGEVRSPYRVFPARLLVQYPQLDTAWMQHATDSLASYAQTYALQYYLAKILNYVKYYLIFKIKIYIMTYKYTLDCIIYASD